MIARESGGEGFGLREDYQQPPFDDGQRINCDFKTPFKDATCVERYILVRAQVPLPKCPYEGRGITYP